MDLKIMTTEEVFKHNSASDCWIIINGKVFDITKFLTLHPAGQNVILTHAGKDCTIVFNQFHTDLVLQKYSKFQVGIIKDFVEQPEPFVLHALSLDQQGFYSPYFDDSHIRLRLAVRQWCQINLEPFVEEWAQTEKIPSSLYKHAADVGLIAVTMGCPWPTKFRKEIKICGIKLENFTSFHEYIVIDEINRIGSSGISGHILAGETIGAPPILHFGSEQMVAKYGQDLIDGNKRICLAITEPYGGSDVAQLQTSAVKSECGKFYIVNGMKKWITNGIFSDLATTAVRTGDAGMFGISLLLIETNLKGVIRKKMNCMAEQGSGTTFFIFDNVRVPVENLIGEENEGFKYIMMNFNHERLAICMSGVSVSRRVYEDAFLYAHQRMTFGQRLIDHSVIRLKLAMMITQIEIAQSHVEQCVYNFDKMDKMQKLQCLPGAISLLKVNCCQAFEYCCKEAVQIFGGFGYTTGGKGSRVERMYKEVKGMILIGGSEEIMLDLAIKMSSRQMPEL